MFAGISAALDGRKQVSTSTGSLSLGRKKVTGPSPTEDELNSKGSKGSSATEEQSIVLTEWSNEELLIQLRTFAAVTVNIDNCVESLHVESVRLLDRPQNILLEVFRRFAVSIEHISLNSCYIDDDQFELFATSLNRLYHLKTLRLKSNILTTTTLQRIIDIFMSESKHIPRKMSSGEKKTKRTPLEIFDFRNNNCTCDDGLLLFESICHRTSADGDRTLTMKEVNGIKVQDLLKKTQITKLELKGESIRFMEVAILCELLPMVTHIKYLGLSGNYLDAKAGAYLAEHLMNLTHINVIDLTDNPITNEEKNFIAIENLVKLVRHRNHITDLILGDIVKSVEMKSKITTSLQVNRSIFKPNPDNSFENFVKIVMDSRGLITKPKKIESDLSNYLSKDIAFCKKYNIPERTITMNGNQITLGLKQ